jgi:hypothetical protein
MIVKILNNIINKFIPWKAAAPFKGLGSLCWQGTEREVFYNHINNREYFKALQIIRTKGTRYSLDEMGDLMNAFERDVISGQIIVIEKVNNENK